MAQCAHNGCTFRGCRFTPEALNSIMEFDHVIRVRDDGSVTDEPGLYAPDVYSEDDGSVTIGGTGWGLLNGYSGQESYSGPVMHPSEYIGGGMARDILAEPGVYVAVVVSDYSDGETDGWAVLRRDA